MKFICPVCNKKIEKPLPNTPAFKYFPFCSERCKLIDLGDWLDAEYKIISKPASGGKTRENE